MKEKKKIILIPYPAQGHVTPMLKLAAVIAGLGRFQPVVLTPEFIHRSISPRIHGVLCLPLPDGLDGGTPPPDFFAVERAMEEAMPPALEELLLREMAGGVACVVADLLASWAVEVARRCGVTVAGFWPAMHATYRLVAAIPHLVRTGVISENVAFLLSLDSRRSPPPSSSPLPPPPEIPGEAASPAKLPPQPEISSLSLCQQFHLLRQNLLIRRSSFPTSQWPRSSSAVINGVIRLRILHRRPSRVDLSFLFGRPIWSSARMASMANAAMSNAARRY